MKETLADWAARHKLSSIAGSWVVVMTAAGAIIINDPWVLCFSFAPCLSCLRSCTNRSAPRIIVDAVSSHRHIPVQHKGCKNLLTLSAVLIQWPCQVAKCVEIPRSRNEPTDVAFHRIQLVVTILEWAWWVLYFITCWCFAEGLLAARSTQR